LSESARAAMELVVLVHQELSTQALQTNLLSTLRREQP
ncbi:MAG: hypothetical protein UX72_C0040G0014, partial [Parcubacteria group bacterium GW2011_GWA2_47_10]